VENNSTLHRGHALVTPRTTYHLDQISNHYPNTASELGAKVGLHRNLRSLEWFDAADMDEFLPRMFNCANPWEMQDFVEDFIFTAAAIEVQRFELGLLPTWKGAEGNEVSRRRVLAAAHMMCNKFLDNKMALKGRGGKLREEAVVEGVLVLRDYYRLRPDLLPPLRDKARLESGEKEAGGGEEGRDVSLEGEWEEMEEDTVTVLMAETFARLEKEHVQLHMDGLRNVWIVKPGHGTRGQGIKCYDNLESIIALASKRGGGKKSVVVQKYVEPCLLLEVCTYSMKIYNCYGVVEPGSREKTVGEIKHFDHTDLSGLTQVLPSFLQMDQRIPIKLNLTYRPKK